LAGWLEHRLHIDPQAKPEVYAQVSASAEIGDLNYWLELLLSAGIATLGLVLNSAAVVIGAMLISPLMGPIIAAGLALAAADLYLGIKSLLNLAISILAAICFSAALVWLLPFQVATPEILARTQPNLLDLGVAILSGLAGSLIVCRGGRGGGVMAMPGVAIAVALMPPLCTIGFGVGAGFQSNIISGARLLFVTNLAAIVTSAFLVFLLVRMDAPEVRLQIDEAIAARSSSDALYRLLQHTRLAQSLADIGRLRWRILMPVLVLGILFVPLRNALHQVRDEAVARAAIREAIRRLAPAGAVLSQQVNLGTDQIQVRLILAESVADAKVAEAQHFVMKRTGKDVNLQVRKVAGEEELALLRARLSRPAPPPPQTLASMRAEVLARLEKPLKEIWPAEEVPLLGYELGFDPEGILVRVRYRAPKPLDATAEQIISAFLRKQLGIDQLRVELENTPPPSAARERSAPRRKR
jgi:uncharacterized hydrophobic protein (TIGR00271 family)